MIHLPFQYGTTRNFCGVPNYNGSQKFVVLGAPVDCATTFRSGTRLAPNAIRDASMMLTDGYHDLFPVDLKNYVGDAGDMPLPTGNNTVVDTVIYNSITSFDRNKHLVTLGGHHGITYSILRAMSVVKGTPISVVHFDAHCDTWSDHFGEPYGHGTWIYNLVNEGKINASDIISIGIRSPADKDSREYLSKNGGTTIFSRQAMRYSPRSMADIIIAKIGNKPCYLSFDIDCLDPAYAPGTGTPEVAGLTTAWVLETLELLHSLNWIGMDCVEVSPPFDHSQITSLAAATVVWQYLSMAANYYNQ